MTDIWLAVHAKEKDISIISVEMSNDWGILARGKAFRKSYQISFQKDAYQTWVVNNYFFKDVVGLRSILSLYFNHANNPHCIVAIRFKF